MTTPRSAPPTPSDDRSATPPVPVGTVIVPPTGTSPADPPAGRRFRVSKRTVVGLAIFVGVLLFFLTQTRLTATLLKFETIERAQTARGRSAFGQVIDPFTLPPPLRWIAYGINLWDANAIGMFFAILLGGAAVGAFNPGDRLRRLVGRKGAVGAGVGGVMGLPLFMCSACSAPVSMGFLRNGAAVETSLGMILGSALFNPIGIFAIFIVFPLPMALARVAFGLAAILLLAPLVARWQRGRVPEAAAAMACDLPGADGRALEPDPPTWWAAVVDGLRRWVRNSLDIAYRLGPPMLLATLLVGVIFTFIPPQELSDRVGTGLIALAVAAAVGTLLQLPTLFEIPLVLGVLALGLGVGPATALLVTMPSVGLVTLGITRAELGWGAPSLLLAGTFVGGLVAGLVVGWL